MKLKKENLIFVEEAMKHPRIIELVNEASERIWYKVSDLTSFEYVCYRNIGQTFLEKKNIKSKVGIATRIINRAEAWYIKYRGCEPVQSIEALAGLDDEGVEQPLEINDVLADVEKDLIREETRNEKAALLAKGDSRKLAVLKAWDEGYHNALELSRILANTFGGTASAHRKAIQRFKTECQERFLDAV